MSFLEQLGIESTNSGAYHGKWLATSGASLASISPATGQTIASVEGVLQYALNRAIARHPHSQAIALSLEDIDIGVRVVAATSEH